MDMKLQEKILRDRWHELTTRLRKIDTDLGRTKAIDDEDRAIENENDEVLEGLGQAGEEELRAIDAALERIAKGTTAPVPAAAPGSPRPALQCCRRRRSARIARRASKRAIKNTLGSSQRFNLTPPGVRLRLAQFGATIPSL